MKPGELALMGIGSILVGGIIALSPFINILLGWWLSPLLILGGILAIFASMFLALWEALRISTRFLICLLFREEEEGRPAIHHFVLNTRVWRLLGGGHCPSFLHRMAFLLIFLFVTSSNPLPEGLADGGFVFDHSLYAKVLRNHVVQGEVDYPSLKSRRENLEAYLQSLDGLSKQDYEAMGPNEKMAFWINAYNAAAIKLVVDHYPLSRSLGWRALAYPDASIQQIPHVWDRKVLEVFGNPLSLDDIEHKILRKEFRDAKIHFALVCASRGCPRLRGEPYRGERLDEQLEDQVRRFVLDSEKVRYEEPADTLHLSPIFKWFHEDFEKYGGVRSFAKAYLPETIKMSISETTKIKWLDYDWSLNERRAYDDLQRSSRVDLRVFRDPSVHTSPESVSRAHQKVPALQGVPPEAQAGTA